MPAVANVPAWNPSSVDKKRPGKKSVNNYLTETIPKSLYHFQTFYDIIYVFKVTKEETFMRGFVGTSNASDIESAISEATSGLRNADLLILLAPYEKASQAAVLLSERYPSVPMIGTCGASIAKSSISDDQLVVIGFAGVTVSCGLIDDVRTSPITSIKSFEDNLKSISPDSSNTICMEFVTGSEEKVMTTINSVLSRYDISLLGGSSDNVPLGEKHIVIYNGKTYNRSCVYAFIRNNAGKIKLFSENIYEPFSSKPHMATLVDTNTKTLFQLDDIPAYEVYSEETGCDKDSIIDNMAKNPLGRAIGDDIYITATKSLDMNGVMFNYKALYENDRVYIMKPGDYRDIHANTMQAIQNETNRVSFIFGLEDANRLKLFADDEYLSEYTDSLSALGSFAALITKSQQCNRQNCNQTLVCAVFE